VDKEARRMLLSGGGYLKGDIWCPNIPYSIECKNSERHNIWKEWEQAESEAKMSEEPILCISGNYRPVLAVIKLDTLLNLLQMRKQLFDSIDK